MEIHHFCFIRRYVYPLYIHIFLQHVRYCLVTLCVFQSRERSEIFLHRILSSISATHVYLITKMLKKRLLKLIVLQDFQQRNLTFRAMCDIINSLHQHIELICFCVLCCINYSTYRMNLHDNNHTFNYITVHFER